MGKSMNVFLLILALGVSLVACDRTDEGRRSDATGRAESDKGKDTTASTPRTDSPGSAPRSNAPGDTAKMSNSDLESAVKAKLTSDEQLRNADLKVDANADKNEVTLSGTVRSQAERSKAIDLAKSAHSGVTVNDKIDVKPAA
jgi:osmotically-inducible protein OsmY